MIAEEVEGAFTFGELAGHIAGRPSERIPLAHLPVELFRPPLESDGLEWPDFTASELADWPGSYRHLDGPRRVPPEVALVLAFARYIPRPREEASFLLRRHSVGGYRRMEFRFAAIPLKLSPGGSIIGSTIARKWHGSGVVASLSPLQAIEDYRASLQACGLDCDQSHHWFSEAAYPVDLDDTSLERLSRVRDLDELPVSIDSLDAACLLILAPNSAC